jgi:amino acid adenylation domain-containing protein
MNQPLRIAGRYPLSPQQRRILKNTASGYLPSSRLDLRLHGNQPAARICDAMASIVARHQALRTRFDGTAAAIPVQTVLSPESASVLDGLFTLDPGAQAATVTLPALAADAATLLLIARELSIQLGGDSPAEEPIQYPQFVEWQQEMLAEGEPMALPRDMTSWTSPLPRFAGARPPQRAFIPCAIELEPADGLLHRSQWLACFCALVARWRGADTSHVWVHCASRDLDDLAGVCGPIARWLPLSAPYTGQGSWKALIEYLAHATAQLGRDALAYSYDALPPAGESLGCGFEFHTVPVDPEVEVLAVDSCAERFDLRLCVLESQGRVSAALHYDGACVSDGAAQAFAHQMEILARDSRDRMMSKPQHCPLISIEEYRASVRGAIALSTPLFVHERIHSVARSSPNAPAIVAADGELRYGELSETALRLACRLQIRGAAPERVVAIYLERGCRAVISLLGALTAGASYLMLDPEYPLAWTTQVLERSGAVAVITDETGSKVLRETAWRDRILLYGSSELVGAWRPPQVLPNNLAYVVFTSGSTGIPKGVLVEHRHIAAYTSSIVGFLGLSPGTRFAVVSTFAADLANTGIFGALASGGVLHILSAQLAFDSEALDAYLRAHAIDCMKIVPSHFRALKQSGAVARPSQCLILGGEATPRGWIDDEPPEQRSVVNHYGPAEAAVGAMVFRYEGPFEDPQAPVLPLGGPLPHAQAHLLDGNLFPVPDGAPGEICIGGAAVARGYLDDPLATAEKFIPDPFSDKPGARLYRTGDRANKLSSGRLLFLGRCDNQLKIRGYRVETGEVEHALLGLQGVRKAAVLIDRSADHAPKLIACVESSGASMNASAIRDALGSRLPEHMIPSRILVLPHLPLNGNGKLDRVKILDAARKCQPGELPEAPFERIVAETWASVLNTETVGLRDNFFDLGGHSLLAMSVVSRVRRIFRLDATPRDLFDHATVADFCGCLRNKEPRPGHIDEITRIVLDLGAAAVAHQEA